MTLYMETTKIAPEHTVSQIQSLLGRCGASGVITEYKEGEVCAVSFQVDINGKI